ncbi:hypothetical protein O6H91_09G055100 [Diphasiastrum complanatum]|uniref:Uncharacterized protein n=1 Tax=Diphasiastrum complanatum TaxID=34168 RepID=A0ACC2CQD9_DIPCM|nr:hypothetical protein O6H91_09G055100 [Diphasiastrum complanatum]
MRQVLSIMKAGAVLDYAVFRLTPTRTRCELLVSAGGIEEKLVSGLLQPYCSHLQAAQEQVAQGGYSIRLERPQGDGDSRQTAWFTKGTMERFVRFVGTPEVLERVSIIDYELIKLEEALSIQFQENPQFDNKNPTLDSSPPLIGGNISSGLQGDKATNYAKSRCASVDVNGFDTVENARWGLLRAMEARKYMLQKEQGMAFARATAAGFSMDHISDLIAFAECFGASRLREACFKYLALYKKKQEAGVWIEEMELAASEAALTHAEQGHGAYTNLKAMPDTWSDIHCEVGGYKLDELHGNVALRSNGGFYNGVPPVDEDNSSHGGLDTFRSPTSYNLGAGDLGFSGYSHESLPGLPGSMASIPYSSPSFQRHAQNRLYNNGHYTEHASSMRMETGQEALLVNQRHPAPAFVPQLGSNVYVRDNPQEANQYSFQASVDEQSQGLLRAYYTSPGLKVAYNSENSRRYFDGPSQANGYEHDIGQSNVSLVGAKDQIYAQQNGYLNLRSPGGKPDEPSSDDSLSHAAASDADTPVNHQKISPMQSNAATSNAETETPTSPKKRSSSKKLQVGRTSGRRSGIVLIKNINYITSSSQNDSIPGASMNKNAETGDDGDGDEESLPENAIQEVDISKQDKNVYLGNQDVLSNSNGRPGADDIQVLNIKLEPKRERNHVRSSWKNSENSAVTEDNGISDALVQERGDFCASLQGNKNESLFKSVSFHGDQGPYSFESEGFYENQKPKNSLEEDFQLSPDGECKPHKNIAPRYGSLEDMDRSSQSHIRTLRPSSDMLLLPTRGSKTESQSLKDSTKMEQQHDQNDSVSQRTNQASDSFIVPERCGRLEPVPFGDQHLTECMEDTSLTEKDELIVENDSFMVPARSMPVKQTNTSWKSTFNMEAEFPSDDHKNTADDEKKNQKPVDCSTSFDDLMLIPERSFIRETVSRSWDNPLDSDVNLLGSMCNTNELNDVNTEEKPEESSEKKETLLSSKKVTKTSVQVGENGNLARRKSFPTARGDKLSNKTAGSPSRTGNTWTAKMTNPLKTKKEKEEEERKRLEDLKLQRLERISARSNSSGPTKSAASTLRVSKPPSPGVKSNSVNSIPSLSNQKSPHFIPGRSISGEKRLDRSVSSSLELKNRK